MVCEFVQPANAQLPTLVTLLGIVMLVRLVAFSNAQLPMSVNWLLASNVTVVRLVAFRNALAPMLVTLLGIVMLVRLVALKNAPHSMLVN